MVVKCVITPVHPLLSVATHRRREDPQTPPHLVPTLQEAITWVNDGQCAHSVVFSTRCAQLNVVPTIMMDTGLGKHSVVLNLRFSEIQKLGVNRTHKQF